MSALLPLGAPAPSEQAVPPEDAVELGAAAVTGEQLGPQP